MTYLTSDSLSEMTVEKSDVGPNNGDRAQTLFRRHVFFVSGFDPRGLRRYHRLINRSMRSLAEQKNVELQIGKPESSGPFSTRWRVDAHGSEGDLRTTFELLHWDDIIRLHWKSKGRIAVQVAAVRALWVYWRAGVLAEVKAHARAFWMALLLQGLAPIGFALAALIVALAVGGLSAFAARGYGLPAFAGWALALPVFIAALYASNAGWRTLNMEWFTRCLACLVETAFGEKPGWDERCAEFAKRLASAERDGEADEIVFLGHSIGALIAMKALWRWAAIRDEASAPGKIEFVTLGQSFAYYTLIEPGRATLREGCDIAASASVEWFDVTSGSDPASACHLSPLVGAQEIGRSAVVRSWDPEFHRILSPERFKYIRKRPLDFHFQYLDRADRADGFDLIRLLSSSAPFFAEAPR